MDKDDRVGEFMAWAQGQPDSLGDAPPDEVRRVARELIERSGGARVTEAHVLASIDASEGQDGSAKPLIEKAGDLFLRFEEALRLAGRGSPAPKGPLATHRPEGLPPVDMTGSPSHVDTKTRPVADPLPVSSPRSIAAPPQPAAVTFAPVSTPAAGTFRCPTCRTMVALTVAGVCPRCGKAPPRLVQTSTHASPQAVRPPAARGVFLAAGAAALALGGTFGGMRVGATACQAIRSENVAGLFRSEHLGLEVTFAKGWRRMKKADRSEPVPASDFILGSEGSPRAQLVIGVLDAPSPAPALDDAEDDSFQELVGERSLIQSFARSAGIDASLDPGACEVVTFGTRHAGLCQGIARRASREHLFIYFMVQGERLIVAAFTSREGVEEAAAAAESIVESIEPIRP